MELLTDIYLIGSGEIGISNPFDCNVYLIDCGEEAILIDSGVGISTSELIKNIKKHININKLKKVFLTHVHADHAGGARDFQDLGIEVYVSDIEANMLKYEQKEIIEALQLAKNCGAYPEDYEYKFFNPDRCIENQEIFQVGKYELIPIHMEGHSPGLLCFYLRTNEVNILFSGDQVFINGDIGLLNAPGSGLDGFRKDMGKLANLSVDVLLPGHRLFVLRNGQIHINKAIDNLTKVFVPSTF